LAYVVVVHLAPDHPSQLNAILGGCTRMPVEQVEDAPTLRPNCVYVIAPDRELVIEGENLASRLISEPRIRRAPIDMFFRSAAAARGDGLAVVLSGAGSDGALGISRYEGGDFTHRLIYDNLENTVSQYSRASFRLKPRSGLGTTIG
jgi:two-component system, chemotaxis family, CheB/CheR fusion protein